MYLFFVHGIFFLGEKCGLGAVQLIRIIAPITQMLLIRLSNLIILDDLNRLFIVLIGDVELVLDTISNLLAVLQWRVVFLHGQPLFLLSTFILLFFDLDIVVSK